MVPRLNLSLVFSVISVVSLSVLSFKVSLNPLSLFYLTSKLFLKSSPQSLCKSSISSRSNWLISIGSHEAIFYMLYNIMPENLYPQLPTAQSMSQESFNIEMVRKYYQDIANLKEKYSEKQQRYKNAHNKLLHASTGASSVALVNGISTIGTSVTAVGLPISVSLAIVSTVSTCAGACLLLTSRKYKKELLKCHELLDKITSSLATFETLISLSIDDGSVIDA